MAPLKIRVNVKMLMFDQILDILKKISERNINAIRRIAGKPRHGGDHGLRYPELTLMDNVGFLNRLDSGERNNTGVKECFLTVLASISVPYEIGPRTLGFWSRQTNGITFSMTHLIADGNALFIPFTGRPGAHSLGITTPILTENCGTIREDKKTEDLLFCAAHK
jgi:hypothetical protein